MVWPDLVDLAPDQDITHDLTGIKRGVRITLDW